MLEQAHFPPYDLGSLTYTDIKTLLLQQPRSVALLAVGSVEAHGPHLPLNTDTLIAEAVLNHASLKLHAAGYCPVRLPTLNYAVTEWAAMFPGSSSLKRETAEAMVLETALAAHGMGFAHVVLINAHLEPENILALRSVCKRFEKETGRALLFPDKTRRRNALRLTAEFQSGSCHAGQYETSLLLAIAPKLVKQEIAHTLGDHFVSLSEKMQEGKSGFVECGLPDAYCGSPANASAEEGSRSLSILSDMVLEVVKTAAQPPVR